MNIIALEDGMTIVTINDVLQSLQRNCEELKPVGSNDLFGETVTESDLIRSVMAITSYASNLARRLSIMQELNDYQSKST